VTPQFQPFGENQTNIDATVLIALGAITAPSHWSPSSTTCATPAGSAFTVAAIILREVARALEGEE
jgi:hypothetical protein